MECLSNFADVCACVLSVARKHEQKHVEVICFYDKWLFK